MKSVNDWNVYVLQEKMKGHRVSLDSIITDYVTRYQKVTNLDIFEYVYKQIGDDYRNLDFQNYIQAIINRKVAHSEFCCDGHYYSIRRQ